MKCIFSIVFLLAFYQTSAAQSFYSFKLDTLGGKKVIDFSDFKGAKVLVVPFNIRTPYFSQMAELNKLSQHYNRRLKIILCPTNDFQDIHYSEDQIMRSIRNYSKEFVVTSIVITSGNEVHPFFKWLYQHASNKLKMDRGLLYQKILIDENGGIIQVFDRNDSPVSTYFISKIENYN
ncbi:MAG: hypothetical protein KGO81_01040 [Bacteroidota bacterium]|nr:hypothetical protein [Bacteroidota bacterium]